MFLRPIEITHLIDEVATLLQSIVGLNITIVERLSPSLPAILGDSAQIRRMLLNLVTNAAEAIATVPGTITVSTALRTIDSHASTSRGLEIPPGEYVEIAVSDSGPGIDPALHRRIFEPFYTTKFTGRGLGLAVVQGIVRAHGGTLSIESSLGRGTTFTIFLPTEPSARPAPPQPLTPPQPAPQTTPQTILVVDDEASVRQTIAQMLAQLGWRVQTAENGQSALAIIREQDSALAAVLLDLTMPDQSGADVYLEIRRLSRNLPVILISGYTADEVDQRFGDQAPPPFLHKPFGLGVLRATLLRALAPDALRV